MAPASQAQFAGIDGCRGGWIMAELDRKSGTISLTIAPDWQRLAPRGRVIAVDMPIGLTDVQRRRADIEARRLLPGRAASVFSVPRRGALAHTTWTDANRWSKDNGYGGVSKQVWNIVPKMRELDQALNAHDQDRVFEAHPELAFARMNDGVPLVSKHTGPGRRARMAALKAQGITGIEGALAEINRAKAKEDDALDAIALSLTAEHIAQGTARFVPERDQWSEQGWLMRIWY